MEADPPLPEFIMLLTSGSVWTVPSGVLVVILLLLLLCSALISASEVAFFSITQKDLDNLDSIYVKSNDRINLLKSRPRELLATILIANNFINIAIVLISDFLLRRILTEAMLLTWAEGLQNMISIGFLSAQTISHTISFLITVIGVTFLLVLFGEVAPKIYANLNNIRHARLMATPLLLLSNLFSPLNNLLISWSSRFEERVYRRRLTTQSMTDKKELDKAIELTVSEDEHKEDVDILKGIIKFGDVITKQIMKSRVDVVALDKQQKFGEVLNTIKESGFSRIPVYEDDFDNIKGILYVKDLLGFTDKGDDFSWQDLVRNNVLYVPESKKIDELLKEFQSKRTHMAIVVDEYGGSSGLVTLEDIMEEVVGDIKDEFDTEEEVEYMKIDDHNFIFEGKTLLNDVARLAGIDSTVFDEGRGSADSLAGLILELEGKIPKRDKEITYKNLKFKIVSVNKKRIERINVRL